jgi:hypothetical protein
MKQEILLDKAVENSKQLQLHNFDFSNFPTTNPADVCEAPGGYECRGAKE